MENKQITLKEMYFELKNLEKALQKKGIINQVELAENKEKIGSQSKQVEIFADEDLLKEDWLSPEDEEAWKNL